MDKERDRKRERMICTHRNKKNMNTTALYYITVSTVRRQYNQTRQEIFKLKLNKVKVRRGLIIGELYNLFMYFFVAVAVVVIVVVVVVVVVAAVVVVVLKYFNL